MSSIPAARPKHLNLLRIRLPFPALVSILHRVSGALLFLALPLLLCAFNLSLRSAHDYGRVLDVLSAWPVKILLVGLCWAFFHHLCAGLRHLALDMHWGVGLKAARASAFAAFAGAALMTAWAAYRIWA